MRADTQAERIEPMTLEQGVETLTARDRYPVDFAAGNSHSLAILNDGTLWAWGINSQGRTGLGITTGSTLAPTQVGTSTNWSSVSAGNNHSLAIQSNGTLWAWGSNNLGVTGLGIDTGSTLAPTQVGTSTNWNSVTQGNSHSLAIQSNGTLWAWGNNFSGRTGLGITTGSTLAPTQVGTSTNWSSVSAGNNHSLAIQSNGTLWAWGSNNLGVTGLGIDTGSTLAPTQVGTSTNWNSVTKGNMHSLAIQSNGTLWAWGINTGGQTGHNTTGNTLIPTQVGTSTNWSSVSATTNHSLAVQSNGTLWAWGDNTSGRTGLGIDTGSTPIPTQVGTSTNWSSVSAGNNHSLAIQSNGTLWAWGNNANGRTGLGTTTGSTPTPTPVGPVTVTTMTPTGTDLAPDSINTLTINFDFPVRSGLGDRVLTLTNTATNNTVTLGQWVLAADGLSMTAPITGAIDYETTYRIDISGWHSIFGAPLTASNQTFTTGERAPDPFTVTQVLPEGTNVAVDTDNLVITFSEPVNTTTGSRSVTIAGAQLNHSFDTANAIVPVSEPGFWNAERTVLTLSMPEVLEFDTEYTVNTTGFVAVAGGALVPHTHTFTTEAQPPEGAFTKTLTLPEGTTIPSPSFTFNFTPQQVVLDDTVTPNISSRPSADFATLLTNQTITLNPSDAITENGTTTITGTLDIAQILSNLTFPGGGVYVWNVSELSGSSNTTTPSHMSYDDTLFQIRAWVNRYGDLEYIAIHNLERGEGTEIIDLGKTEDGINFFNTYMRQTGTEDNPALEVSKEVSGDLANLDTLFNFTLTLEAHTLAPITNTPPATLPTTLFTARIVNSEGIVVDRAVTITPGANNTYTLTFQLRHGETLQIPTLPAGTTFTTTEAAHPEFSPSATITLGGVQLEADYEGSVNTALTTGSHITRDTGRSAADFTNDHFSAPHTGLVVTTNTPLALIVGMGLLLTVMLALRNRQRIERMPL